ncbi:MAG TPA: glycoside hydrolase domain-containing protein [Polyangia bacterium]
MPKYDFLAMIAALGALASCSGPSKPATPLARKLSVWVQGVGKKVQPTTAPGSETAASVAIYRNATVSFQVVVLAPDGDLDGVTVAAGDLIDGHGHTLSKANLSLFRAAFIDFRNVTVYGGNLPVPANSPTSDSLIPDPLIPLVDPYTGANAGQPFGVKVGTNQPLFVDIFVPKTTPAGTYTGNLRLAAAGGLTTEVPISLTVWDLDLPDMGSVTTHFRMSTNDLIQYHKGTWAGSGNNSYLDWNATSKQLVKRYEELAHAHRIDIGQNFVTLPENGCAVPKDWVDYDKSMQPYMDGSYWADGVASTRIATPFSPGADYGMEATCTQAQYTAIAAAWATHLKTRGWFTRAIVYAADEPSESVFPRIAQQSAWLQQADPDWLAQIMDTTAPTPTSTPILNPALGIYCTALAWYDNWNDHGAIYGRAEWPGLFAMGKKLWFYESNAQDAPYPTFATNTLDGLEPTIMMWGAWYEKATGFLYWDISNWDKQDPWGPTIAYGKTGDGVLIYPGNHNGRLAPAGSPNGVAIDGPIPSYRLQMVRAGLQDWALFRLAEDKGLGDLARTQVAQVYSQLGGCTYSGCPKPASGFLWKSDEDLMATVRKAIVEAILQVP